MHWGIVVAAAFIVGEIVLIHLLKRVAPENAFGALFLLGVLVVSAGWSMPLAVATSLASTFAYLYIHLEGADSLAPAVFVFLPMALLANLLAGQARSQTQESEQRRREADLSAELARLMLGAGDLSHALDRAGQRMARVLDVPEVTLTPGSVEPDDEHYAIPLHSGDERIGTLLVPAHLPLNTLRRWQRMVPALEALLTAAMDREKITAELEASRKELERFFDVASELLFISDQHTLTRINPTFTRTLGFTDAELTERPFIDLVHPDDRADTLRTLDVLRADHRDAQFENRCVCKGGETRWFQWNVVSDHGLWFGAGRDVTQRRLEQDRLREAQRQIEASHKEVSALATQQTALRRVATQVARGAKPDDVYPLAVGELSVGLGVSHATLLRYESESTAVVVAALDIESAQRLQVGNRLQLEGDSLATRILRTGLPARIDSYDGLDSEIAVRLRGFGVRAGVGAPVIVDGRTWGALIAGTSRDAPLPPGTEERIGDFADLVSTAIFNAESRAEITASRARIVAAADQARRRFERDLHDGAQQRIVSLGLELRAVQASAPPENSELQDQMSHVVDGLAGLYADLQELSRGIHPAILSKGGLGPALRTLARRSTVPVVLDVDVGHRLPESVEVAAYYVVAEALTNAAKHASASEVSVRAAADDDELAVSVSDDGIGGAVSGGGSGLIGLKDRVEALSGRLQVSSPPGAGTTLSVRIPLAC
ncbi:ATP-binding protein [Mycolicibacterium goodii]|uniref:histidine kinase n=1 Tax=Mycolicibacterium goodii TaxID=134601 RepID=A0A0K0XH32_MYCGD|nr:histidine kinase [Mycolicibacterium goodii]